MQIEIKNFLSQCESIPAYTLLNFFCRTTIIGIVIFADLKTECTSAPQSGMKQDDTTKMVDNIQPAT